MGRKKPDIYDLQKQRHWEGRDRSSTIQEKFPTLINSLTISMTFKNPDWGGDPSPQEHNYRQESEAFFDFGCPHVECVSGGFNISSAVSELVDKNGKETSGEITCQGWQDKERINKHRCMLKMQYRIMASYKNGAYRDRDAHR